ncbi:response regulator transcription factor [Corynebacterium accolens]|uniref:response regulator transcription factor n=1 Tax=Corynebacterium accolens TaxID=38284 RepID=UPI00254B4740|nr:response regulator transcription factor [Corynebacterium accolens]MDK8499046.1 response regulator transcription factor [Corynebacterium accolens]MDK8681871.1 response regulator transcription factor [Corynebacterium accolens]
MVLRVKTALLLVDDDPLVLEALGHYFATAEDMEVRATAENGKDALEQLKANDIDAVIADIHMPEMDGTVLLREINKLEDPPVFIAMTAMDNDDTLKEVMSHKAAAYILKSSKPAYIQDTVREAVRGGTVVAPQSLTRLFQQMPELHTDNDAAATPDHTPEAPTISPAQERILNLVCEGKSNEEIATSTHYAAGTVKKYVSSLLSEFHAKSRLELAVKALKAGYGK